MNTRIGAWGLGIGTVAALALGAAFGSGLAARSGSPAGAGSPEPRPAVHAPLRVCADPNNLPFSNDKLEGFENKLASLVARELHAELQYTWWAQRRGFVRNTIKAGSCDVIMGVPSGYDLTLVTRPYYRSLYVFVTRRDSGIRVRSLDDPILRRVKVGVQLIGDDGQNTPPAHALADRHIVQNVVGYTVYGDYLQPNPPARIVTAVADREVDVAMVWGPLAGYFGARQNPPLAIAPVAPLVDRNGMPLAFDIGVGVNRKLKPLRDEIDAVLVRRRTEIERLLDSYHVPRVPAAAAEATHGY